MRREVAKQGATRMRKARSRDLASALLLRSFFIRGYALSAARERRTTISMVPVRRSPYVRLHDGNPWPECPQLGRKRLVRSGRQRRSAKLSGDGRKADIS